MELKDLSPREYQQIDDCAYMRFSYRRWLEVALKRTFVSGPYNSHTATRTFNGVDFPIAINRALHGWDAGIKELKRKLPEDRVPGGVVISPDFAGASVNIGSYLSGLPMQMNRYENTTTYGRERRVLAFQMNQPGSTSAADLLKIGLQAIKAVNAINTKYDVRVVVFFTDREFSRESKHKHIEVIVKDFNDRLVINNVAMAFSPEALRRFDFSIMEMFKGVADLRGYGIYDAETIKTRVAKASGVFQSITTEKTLVVNSTNVKVLKSLDFSEIVEERLNAGTLFGDEQITVYER